MDLQPLKNRRKWNRWQTSQKRNYTGSPPTHPNLHHRKYVNKLITLKKDSPLATPHPLATQNKSAIKAIFRLRLNAVLRLYHVNGQTRFCPHSHADNTVNHILTFYFTFNSVKKEKNLEKQSHPKATIYNWHLSVPPYITCKKCHKALSHYLQQTHTI